MVGGGIANVALAGRDGMLTQAAGACRQPQNARCRTCVERGYHASRVPALFPTQVASARVFWPAEGYHQRYLQKGGQNAD